MNPSTRILYLTLAIIAGIMGIEHGIGEMLQGYRPTESVFILSWPGSPFFKIMSGEPAMTIVPNYLITGLLAILFSASFLVVFIKSRLNKQAITILFILLILMLLTGAGFGPPVVGLIAVLIALKRNSPLKTWNKLPVRVHRILFVLWPWVFGLCLFGWLMLFPGAALIAFFTGNDSAYLMIIPILIAFGLIPVTLFMGFSRDILNRHTQADNSLKK